MTSADVVFDAGLHEYRLVDGQRIPSVTEILGAVGVSVDFEMVGSMSSKLADDIEAKRQLGTAVHADCHAYDDDDLDFSAVDPRVEPYVRAWATFRENLGLVPVARERIVWHPTHRYCGTFDGIFEGTSGRWSGKRILVDVKTGDPAAAAGHLQTAAYEAAFLAEHAAERIDARWAVRLCPELQIPYRTVPYWPNSERPGAWRDFEKFLCCLVVYHEQPERTRRAKT